MMHNANLDSLEFKPTEFIQSIWQAGVDSVASDLLVENCVTVDKEFLSIGGDSIPLAEFDRIIVVGAGKAGAGMSRGIAKVLSHEALAEKSVTGFVNVPADCVEPNHLIQLHPGRPAGVNEPCQKGVDGAETILQLVQSASKRDVVICLISGGGSALLPLPIDGITIQQKAATGRHLSRSGATIDELNLVRRALSKIKGGGLLHDCHAHSIHTLIISDVMGNPIETIASGPTLPCEINFELVLETLAKFDPSKSAIPKAVYEALQRRQSKISDSASESNQSQLPRFSNLIIGDIKTATIAASAYASQLKIEVESTFATRSEPSVELIADNIWDWTSKTSRGDKSNATKCYISGGEPTVNLDPNSTGKGGRNQHLAMLLLKKLQDSDLSKADKSRIYFLSGGTDGEDGPTDAAGAIGCLQTVRAAEQKNVLIEDFIARNDSYNFFKTVGGLLMSGPTHTNVCDLRIAMVLKKPS